jgi:hypothetical protein
MTTLVLLRRRRRVVVTDTIGQCGPAQDTVRVK